MKNYYKKMKRIERLFNTFKEKKKKAFETHWKKTIPTYWTALFTAKSIVGTAKKNGPSKALWNRLCLVEIQFENLLNP